MRIDVRGDGNVTNIVKEIMENPSFIWFSTVKTLKCYEGLDLDDNSVLQMFFTKFKKLETFKGIITDYFFPLEFFM